MAGDEHTFFSHSIKGKVIIISVLACLTLLLAWGITKLAFKHMLSAVEKISAPNDKLRLVNELTHKVVQLDQAQKAEILNNPASYTSFFSETRKQLLVIDTLQTLYADDDNQARRINSLKKLLIDHDRLFISYLKVREGLVSNKTFSGQVKLLNDLVNKSSQQNDSSVVTTVKRVHTTTVTPYSKSDSINDNRGFFSKLFGKKKHQTTKVSYNMVNVELHTKPDSDAIARQDSILKGMGQTMRKLEKGQLRRSALFVNKEAVLNNVDNKLIRRILVLLKQVEAEALKQTALNNSAAKNVVTTSVTRISYMILAFLFVTILLLYFILRDVGRVNQYRIDIEAARDEAEYHGQAKQRFLSNMSHEIRTPLQSIIGYAELMRQHGYSRKSDIDAIYSSSEHLMQIVNEVLDYNRIISGKFTITNQIFNMAELLDDVLFSLRLQAEKKGIQLIADYNIPDNKYVQGDPFRLKQILYNLLGNAIKFTDTGEVKLSVASTLIGKGERYVFTVSDTGIGLSGKDIKRIFNEFEQAHAKSHQLKGTGLGLTISKALIEAQGGGINVKSTLGKGSDFIFNLSYENAIEPVNEHNKPINEQQNLNYGTVWLIDDDNFILDLCSAIFNAHGIKNRCFSSPQEILNTDFDPDVKCILMDIRMPEMSGMDLCRLLRRQIPAEVMIYALTAQVLPGELESILDKGFNGVLMKPFKEQELLALVSTVVEKVDRAPKVQLDLSMLKKMTFDDQRQLNKILKRFAEDCIDDIAELRLGMDNHDNEKLVLLVHRIAGRTAQIGAADLAAEFRTMEMDFVKNDLVNAEKINAIILLTNKLQALVKQITNIYMDNGAPEIINT
jgi:signal transduction histidine kinase/CheY-like chemotaxis protein/HPt (histidine-containing phosphotransfer) domain-containing protein